MSQLLISVSGRDRPGIIADVTGVFYRAGANLEDISMTLLEDQFAMMMIVREGGPRRSAGVKKGLEALARKTGLTITVQPLIRRSAVPARRAKGTVPYLVTVAGRDRTGIVHRVTKFFSSRKLNITDLNSRILNQKNREFYVLMLEVDVPRKSSLKQLQSGLQKIGQQLRVDVRFRPLDPMEL